MQVSVVVSHPSPGAHVADAQLSPMFAKTLQLTPSKQLPTVHVRKPGVPG
jgi:hypothetical protein